jgi:hypothetical protein
MNFFGRFSKNAQILTFIKIRTIVVDLFHVNGRMDGGTDGRDEANFAFRHFAKAPKNTS